MNDSELIPLTQSDICQFQGGNTKMVARIHFDKANTKGHNWFGGICKEITLNDRLCVLCINPFFSLGSQRNVDSLVNSQSLFTDMSRPIVKSLKAYQPTFEQRFMLKDSVKLAQQFDRILAIRFGGGTALISANLEDFEKVHSLIERILQHENHQNQKLIRELLKATKI